MSTSDVNKSSGRCSIFQITDSEREGANEKPWNWTFQAILTAVGEGTNGKLGYGSPHGAIGILLSRRVETAVSSGNLAQLRAAMRRLAENRDEV